MNEALACGGYMTPYSSISELIYIAQQTNKHTSGRTQESLYPLCACVPIVRLRARGTTEYWCILTHFLVKTF